MQTPKRKLTIAEVRGFGRLAARQGIGAGHAYCRLSHEYDVTGVPARDYFDAYSDEKAMR